MTELLTPLTDWLNLHPNMITLAIAAMALVESLALIGVLVPGVALLFATATLAGGLQIPLYQCLLAAMLGASAGDICSFLLGRHCHDRALRSWPFSRYPNWSQRGEHFFHRYGSYSVVVGRFIGPIRPVLPFVAGMLGMPTKRFVVVNLLSALVWAPVYVYPGYLLGSSAQQLATSSRWQSSEIAGMAIGAISLIGLLLLWTTHRLLTSKPSVLKPNKNNTLRWQVLVPLTLIAAVAIFFWVFTNQR